MSPPWMPLYIADYRADTAHLSAAEHGAYLLLIMHYWQTGGLPNDDRPLARIACMTTAEWRRARPVISAFFTPEWRHKRIDEEIERAADIADKRRAAARAKHSKSPPPGPGNGGDETSKSPANAEQMQSKCTPDAPSPRVTRAHVPPPPSPSKEAAAAPAHAHTHARLPENWGPSEAVLAYLREAGRSDAEVALDLQEFLLRASEPGEPYRYPDSAFRSFCLSSNAPRHRLAAASNRVLTVVNGASSHVQTSRRSSGNLGEALARRMAANPLFKRGG